MRPLTGYLVTKTKIYRTTSSFTSQSIHRNGKVVPQIVTSLKQGPVYSVAEQKRKMTKV
jgi:hypothetical protein